MKFCNSMKVIFFLLFIFVFCGCDRKNIPNARDYNRFERVLEQVSLVDDNIWNVDICITDDKYMLYRVHLADQKESGELGFLIKYYIYDLKKHTNNELLVDEFMWPLGMEENMIMWHKIQEKKIIWTDWQGKKQKELDYKKLYNDINEKDVNNCELTGFKWDGSNYYLCILDRESKLFILDKDFNLVTKTQGKSINLLDVGGHISIIIGDDKSGKEYVFSEKKGKLEKKGKIGKIVYERMKHSLLFEGDTLYDFYLYSTDSQSANETGTYLIGVKDWKMYNILSYEKMGMDMGTMLIAGFWADGQGGFYQSRLAENYKTLDIYHYSRTDTPGDYSIKNGKTILKLGGVEFPSGLAYIVEQYNRQSSEYYIEIKDYLTEYGTYNDAIQHLNTDLITGNICDIYSFGGIYLDDYVDKGVFMNLQDYFSHRNENNLEDFTDQFYNIAAREDGNIYYLFPYFIISGVGAKEPVDFDDLQIYMDEIDKNTIFLGDTNLALLNWLLRYSGTRYIDEANMVSYVKEESFKTMMGLIKKQSDMQLQYEDSKIMYCKNETLAVKVELLYPYWFFYYEQLLGEGYHVSMPGKDNFIIDPMSVVLGACKETLNREGVYDFFDYIYSPQIYYRCFAYEGFPVFESGWEMWRQEMLAKDNYYDQNHQVHIVTDFVMGVEESERTVKHGDITEEDFLRMRKTVEQAVYLKPMPDRYVYIILEEAEPYFEGKRDLDETCEIIYNRLNIALQE